MYGAERMLLSLASEHRKLKECYVQIAVFKNSRNPRLEAAEAAEKAGIDTTVFPCRGQLDFFVIRELRHFIRKNRIELIHSHGYKADFYAFFAAFRMDIKRVATCHTWYSTSRKMFIYEMLDKKILRRFDAVAAVSRELRSDILKSGLDEHKVQVIRNGIDMERFQPRADTAVFETEFDLQDKKPLIGVIARLSSDKGHIYLINALTRLLAFFPDMRLLVVGDGPERKNLERVLCEGALTDRVIMTGVRRDIERILSALDLFVLPSLKEGLPIALLEAMAAGVPVVATRTGAVPQVIRQNEDGILVPPGDPAALYEAINELLLDQEKARACAANARKRVQDMFSAQVMAGEYTELYNQLFK